MARKGKAGLTQIPIPRLGQYTKCQVSSTCLKDNVERAIKKSEVTKALGDYKEKCPFLKDMPPHGIANSVETAYGHQSQKRCGMLRSDFNK